MKHYLYISAAIILMLLLVFANPLAGKPQYGPYTGSPALEQLKTLVGVWEGTQSMPPQGKKIQVEYRLTAGGSALVETLFPGTPEEMVSLYHDSDGRLSMTHYCMLGNQPRMALKRADHRIIELEFRPEGSDIDPDREAHMHALAIEIKDNEHMIQNWHLFENGRESGVNTLTLKKLR